MPNNLQRNPYGSRKKGKGCETLPTMGPISKVNYTYVKPNKKSMDFRPKMCGWYAFARFNQSSIYPPFPPHKQFTNRSVESFFRKSKAELVGHIVESSGTGVGSSGRQWSDMDTNKKFSGSVTDGRWVTCG